MNKLVVTITLYIISVPKHFKFAVYSIRRPRQKRYKINVILNTCWNLIHLPRNNRSQSVCFERAKVNKNSSNFFPDFQSLEILKFVDIAAVAIYWFIKPLIFGVIWIQEYLHYYYYYYLYSKITRYWFYAFLCCYFVVSLLLKIIKIF